MQTKLLARSKASQTGTPDNNIDPNRCCTPQVIKKKQQKFGSSIGILDLRGKLYVTETVRTIGFVCVLFFLPLLVSGPQLLIGSIVNLLLIGAVWKLSRSKAWPLAFLPSIGAVFHGVLFGPFTIFLVYMMPVIWLENFVLMYIVKHISRERLGILTGSITKAALLFLVACVLVQSSVLPVIFLQAMGILQLVTALIGGVVAFGFIKLSR